ncbi:MAG TPA: hypothetical protein VKX49_30390 [Bryobacteraceae bacterium]|nr:hypothetical protein [Bryobacteraceae bacterium]
MRSFTALFFFSATLAPAQPVVTAVLNSASSNEMISPGCWISIYGTNLAGKPAQAASVPLPKSLGGSSVTVDGKAALLNYVSPQQINALVPYEVSATGMRKIDLVVASQEGTSKPYPIYVNRNAPAIFTRDGAPSGRAHVFDAFFGTVDVLKEQQVVILYATGLGQTDPPVSTDVAGSVAGRTVDEVEVFAGDQKAEVLYAGLAPGFPGVYQLNIRMQQLWTDRIYLRQGNWISNIAQIAITPRNNATNVRGTISPGYPRADSVIEWSQVFEEAGFELELDLVPGAHPFIVAAVADSAGWYMIVDPVNIMYRAWMTGPAGAAVVAGDFSGMLPQPLLDLANGCTPFGNNVIPAARLDRQYLFLIQMLRPGEALRTGDLTGVSEVAWNLRSPTSLGMVDAFGGFVQIPCGSQASRSTTFKLYVDGKAVDSKTVTYKVANR